MRLKHFNIAVLYLLGSLVLAFLSLLYCARRTRRDAERFVRDVSTLRIGQSSLSDITPIGQKYASYVVPNPHAPQVCNPEHCELDFAFHNWPAFLTLRKSDMTSAIFFQTGSLQGIYVGAACAGADRKPPFVPTFVVIVNQALYNPPGFHGGVVSSGNGYSFNIGPGATPEQLGKVYGFNLDFLDRLGGCHDATEMFVESPSNWPRSWWGS